MPFPFAAVAAGISGIAGIFGATQQNKADNDAIRRQNEYQKLLDQFNKDNYKYQWQETRDDYRWLKEDVRINERNTNAELDWRDATAQQDWRFQLAILDKQDQMNAAAYSKSLQTYGLQLDFNNKAVASAYAAEQRKLQEAATELSFQSQDVTIQSLQEAGNAQARGASGRSAGKALHSVLAQAGRNQVILAESLVSAQANYRQASDKIANDKYGADLNAWGNVMVKPIAAARPDAPLAAARPEFHIPRKPGKPPKPIRGMQTPYQSALPSILSSAGNAAAGILGSFV
jgi:hypothetical protein